VSSQERNEQSSVGSDFESANIYYASTSKSASVLAENSSSSCTSVTAGNLGTTGARNSRGFHLIKTPEWQIVRYAPPSQESLIKIKKY
jgi:hypothetical protein